MSSRVKGFKKADYGRVGNKVQENVTSALTPLQNSNIVDGLLLRNVALTTGLNEISHKLDRRLTGWLVIRQRASAIIWDTQDANVTNTKTLKLNVSADVIVDLWVF
jgi:hypothetical protein